MKNKKTNKKRTKYFLLAIPVVLIIIGAYYFSQNNSQSNSKQKMLSDISSLLSLSNQRALTASDIAPLRAEVQNNPIAVSYVDDAIWFANHNIQLHIGHNLGDLYNYYYYGRDQVCVPHEVEHIGDYIKYNDFSRLNSTLERINRGYQDWYQNGVGNEQKFPATYSNFNDLVVMLNATMQNIQNGNYLNTLGNITYITQYDYEGCVIV